MSGPPNKTYHRSWKNLLLDKSYQLRFTLFMVGVCATLMGLLGWGVMTVAGRATAVSINNVLGEELCGAPPDAAAAVPPAGAAPGSTPRPSTQGDVVLGESSMELIEPAKAGPAPQPPPPTPVASAQERTDARASFERCKREQAAKIEELTRREHVIFYVLIAVGVALVIGLLLYGVKMTHRVAGPLHKIGLQLDKLRDGRYDPVYDLRKGDQLMDFYEQFKAAHAGMRRLQGEDVDRLREVIAAADQAQLASRSPEAADALGELRAMLERKERSLS